MEWIGGIDKNNLVFLLQYISEQSTVIMNVGVTHVFLTCYRSEHLQMLQFPEIKSPFITMFAHKDESSLHEKGLGKFMGQ